MLSTPLYQFHLDHPYQTPLSCDQTWWNLIQRLISKHDLNDQIICEVEFHCQYRMKGEICVQEEE